MVDLRVLGNYNWRLSAGHVWKVERLLYEIPHVKIRSSDLRVDRLRRRVLQCFAANTRGASPWTTTIAAPGLKYRPPSPSARSFGVAG